MQNEVPIDGETFDILKFLSGYGWWLLMAIALVAVVLYKKFGKK